MELHSFYGELAVAQGHDDAGSVGVVSPGADGEIGGQIFFGDDEGVIAGRGHGRGESAKDGLAVVLDGAGLAVHQVFGADDLSAKSCADGLMSEADAKHGNFAGEVADDVDADAGVLRSAGAGRDDDALGMHGCDFGDRHLVIAAHLDVSAQFSEILDEVVSERVVVVEDEDHRGIVIGGGWQRAEPLRSAIGLAVGSAAP